MKLFLTLSLLLNCIFVAVVREYAYQTRMARRRYRNEAKKSRDLQRLLDAARDGIEPDFDPELAEYQGDAPT